MYSHVLEEKEKIYTDAYSNYYSVVSGTIYTKVNDYHLAQDLSQEVFIRFYEKFDSIENHRKWLLGALRNVVLEHFNKKRHTTVDIDEIFDDVNLTFTNGFRDARIIITEVIEGSDSFKNENERLIFDLVAVKNFSYVEAKRELGLSLTQVKYGYKQICKRIAHELKLRGINNIEDLL